jgi:hypothetical protein
VQRPGAHVEAVAGRPSGLIADPLCGVGAALVEAVHAGGPAIGVEHVAAVRDGRLTPRRSFHQLTAIRQDRRKGVSLRLFAHEDRLVFRRPGGPRP